MATRKQITEIIRNGTLFSCSVPTSRAKKNFNRVLVDPIRGYTYLHYLNSI